MLLKFRRTQNAEPVLFLATKCIKHFIRKLFDIIIPTGKVILFESAPDFSDNTYPVYVLMRKFLPDYKLVWFVRRGTGRHDADDICYFENRTFREKLKRRYYMARCKVLISCNRFMSKVKRSQISLFLCHGSKTKRVKNTYNLSGQSIDFVNVQSHFFDDIITDDYMCRYEQLVYLGYPRCDYFYSSPRTKDIAKIVNGKYIMWLPTFRRHSNKTRDDAPDSVFNNIGVPLFRSLTSLQAFNSFLESVNMHILYKPHPAQDLDVVQKTPLSNFHIIYDADILSRNLQLYELIAQSEALITDYSSVFWDYLLIDRPIATTTDDLEAWTAKRGFVPGIEEIHAKVSERIPDENSLREFIRNVIIGKDSKRDGRREVRDLANMYQDGNSALRTVNFILDKLGERRKKTIGYVNGVFDMFHVGHLNLLTEAKKRCDYLIVGVYADDVVESYKHHMPVIGEHDRQKIVAAIDCVDKAFVSHTRDQMELWGKFHFDAVFVGDDWKGSERWEHFSEVLAGVGVRVEFIPYTKGISTTILREKIKEEAI